MMRPVTAPALWRGMTTPKTPPNAPSFNPQAVGGMTTPKTPPAHSNHDYSRLAHHRLEVYELALESLVVADRLARSLPRGYGPLADQLRRASQSAFLQLSEGLARSGADRRQRLRNARAEACEAAACIEAIGRLGLVPAADARALQASFGRISAMVYRLAAR